MNVTIELDTITADNSTENDIQEYHEIKQDITLDEVDTSFCSKQSAKPINEYDFFTKFDVNAKPKRTIKKKKTKKKEKPSNIMDLVSSEIGSNSITIAENIISYVNNSKAQQNCYLKTDFRVKYKKSRSIFDAECGWNQNNEIANLSPIFPRVLDSVVTEDYRIPVEYVHPISFDEIVAKHYGNEDIPSKFLDLSIQNIIFKHHHNLSLEWLLCFKVIEKYKQYEYTQRALRDISKELKIIRETKNSLKKDLAKVSPNKKESVRFDESLRKYTEKLIRLKEQHMKLLKNRKDLTHNIISLWSDIEMIRERSECIETPYKLEINKLILDRNEFERYWQDTFDTEFTDKLDIIEYQYINEYLQYKEAKHDPNIVKKLIKPHLQIDENSIKAEAEELANNALPKDQIELELKKDDSIVTDFESFHLKKNLYTFQIYVDDVFVCDSERYPINDMLSVEFTESFSVQILPQNNYIKIVLLENDDIVSHLNINLTEVKKTSSIAEFKVLHLNYGSDVAPSMKYVGSGHSIREIAIANKVRLRSSSLFKEKLFTTCDINVKVGWNDKVEENKYEAMTCSMETGRLLKRLLSGTDKSNLSALMNIISKIYEKDIDDNNMVETLQSLSRLEIRSNDNFSIDENNPDLIRLKLLHLRNVGGFTNIENKLVPFHASQISTEQLNCLQKTNEKEFDRNYLNGREIDMDPVELQRFIGAKYIQKLNKNMLKNLNEYLLQKTYKDVVIDYNFSLRTLFAKSSNLTVLTTLSTSAKQNILTESLNKEQEISVTVLRAFNLLDRSSAMLNEAEDDDDQIAGFKVRPLRPFVRITYKGAAAQTVTAVGSHPTWCHTLKIKNKLQPFTSLEINVFDEYKSQIVDGFSDDDRSNRTVHYRYYQKWLGTLQIPMYAVLYLGSIRGTFKISSPPLLFGYETLENKDSTSFIPEITQLMKKDTSFITLEVTTSLSHLGGLHAYNQPLPSSIEDDYLIKHLNNFLTEYTNQFPTRNISLTFIDSTGRNKCITQFLQPIPLPEKDFFPKAPRCESAMSKSSGRSKSSSSSGRKRDLDTEKVSHDERESLYSGTLQEGDSLTKMINACLRYVSLIPSYEVAESHSVTLLGVELLKVLCGSPLDHTILLASYFIYLGIKCWVAIGLGLPRGPSSYVLIKYDLTTRRIVLENEPLFRNRGFLSKGDGYTWYVCDANSGQRHELRDVGCPLKTVDYIFDNENIWVNMQISQDCENMSFDFSKSSEWQAVFDKAVFVMKQPIVTDQALYATPPNVDGLRVMLENKIKAKVQKWRPHVKTIWNRYCSTALREMLSQWEYWAFNPIGAKPSFSHKLKQLMVTYKIFGFPLNIPFVNTKSVISAIKCTGLHATDDPTVEFALAIESYAYPNNVISIRGTFKISSPPLLFGYETLENKDSTSFIPEITQLMKKDTSFITLEVTTSLSHLGGLHAYNQPLPSSIEDDYLIKHLNNFLTEYTNQFPTRNISLTFIDSTGRNKCITQFLQPIPLPEKDFFPKAPRCESAMSKSSGRSKSSSSSGRKRDLDTEKVSHDERESLYSGTLQEGDSLTKMINACLRYVSLIPSYEVAESHSVTLLGVELLKVLCGSPLDHTILLASYFIYLGIKCWVAIGLGLPRGPSSYVLIKYDLTTRRIVLENEPLFRNRGFLSKGDGYTWYVCDANSGQRHELRDVGCPLKTVDYIFDNENIWVNMQISQDCENMSFDFSKSSEWQAVFDKAVFVMKQPIVTDQALYATPPNVDGLRVMLENKIKAKVQKWRPHVKTIWNRYCSTALREMLSQWEYWAFNPIGAKPSFSHKLKQLMVTYKIFGFPLNIPFVNTKSVISAIKCTGLHATDDPTVEFALAIESYAYPNNVISVWIFLATISRI